MSGPKEKQAMTKSAFIKEVHDAEAMLYHVAKSILKNDADCCDAVQETLLKAYEKLDTLKKEKFCEDRGSPSEPVCRLPYQPRMRS